MDGGRGNGKKGPKVAIDMNAQRRRREQQAVDIRKKRDEEQQAKRRGVSRVHPLGRATHGATAH